MKIKKIANSVGLVGNVTNEYSESKQDSYACDFINGTVLYDNEEGTTGNITLSETSANFRYLEIFYGKASTNTSVKIFNPNGKLASLNLLYKAGTNTIQNTYKEITVSGANISVTNSGFINVTTGTNAVNSSMDDPSIIIYRIIGYK